MLCTIAIARSFTFPLWKLTTLPPLANVAELTSFRSVQKNLPKTLLKVYFQAHAEFFEDVCIRCTKLSTGLLFVEILIDYEVGWSLRRKRNEEASLGDIFPVID